jgi:hypothetical protein
MVKYKSYMRFVISGFFLLACVHGKAQNNGLLQQIDLADNYRIYQLTDSAKAAELGVLNHSFMIRPLRLRENIPAANKLGVFSLDHFSYSRYYNDSIGAGYNNGSFFQATGWQERLSLGLSVNFSNIEISLQPELVIAQNHEQAGIIPSYWEPNFFSRFYFMNINVIDLPSRFGTKPITKFFPGQSHILYHFDDFSAGISSENIWWGPGIRNSLVMTNNAPGFLHFTLQTDKPIATKIGSFEGQFIFGRLDSSGIEPVENVRQATIWPGAYEPKIASANRMITGLALTWQPKWIPNLYLGWAASVYYYDKHTDPSGAPFPDYPYTSSAQDKYVTSLGSVSMRYAMPADDAEIYFEFGRADKPVTGFNLFGDTVPMGYIAGLRKMVSLKKKGQFIEISAEVAHLQMPDPRLVFTAADPYGIPKTRSWYTHPRIRQGYTNYGQSLGAGIGPGSNSQTLNINWINGINKLGLHFERVIHNEDFYYYHYIGGIGVGTPNRHWVDLSFGLHGQWKYKDFMFAANVTSVSALNYLWVKADDYGTNVDGPSISDKRNLNIALSIQYSINKKLSFGKR